MQIGVLTETAPFERRVALTPESAGRLIAAGHSVYVQSGAGDAATEDDDAYRAAGAMIAKSPEEILGNIDLLTAVGQLDQQTAAKLRPGTAVIGLSSPKDGRGPAGVLVDRHASFFALELLPRITRAQSMDALSSQAMVAGYRAGLIAAERLPRFFPLLMTAAGTVPPAKVVVLGAGVAGLQAIATARRLGAQTEGYDVRPETREQVESLGAKFLDLGVSAAGSGGYARELSAEERAAQQNALAEHLKLVDVIVTTAAVPGRPSPKILSAAMVAGMKPGALIVDLAAEGGGNCELTRPGERVEQGGVVVLGPLNLPAGAPLHASEMFARNVYNFVELLVKDGALAPDFEDELVAKSCVTRAGEARLQG